MNIRLPANFSSKTFWINIVVYLVLSMVLLPVYRYQINPDAVSYIGISYKYTRFDFTLAVNGYWGPFISWLLAPLLYIIDDPLLAFRILSILIGLFVLTQSYLLVRRFCFFPFTEFLLLFSITIIILYYSFIVITPDFLFVLFGLMFVNKLINLQRNFNYRNAVLAGIPGACLYLTKNYGFYLVVGTYVILFLSWYIFSNDRVQRRIISRACLISFAVFLTISAFWIVTISVKYGYFTIGTAGTYNHSISGPGYQGSPLYYGGLLTPPNPTATSIREDLSYLKVNDWNAFGSKGNFFHQWYLVKKNGYVLIDNLLQFSYLSFFIIAMILFYSITNLRALIRSEIYPIIVIMTILPCGYLLLVLVSRHIWICNIFLLLTGVYYLEEMIGRKRKLRLILLQTFVILSFVVAPVRVLIEERGTGKQFFLLNKKLKEYNIKGKLASQGNWLASLYMSFYTRSQYYGECRSSDPAGVSNELIEKRINYYLVWSFGTRGEPLKNRILLNYPEITQGKIDGLLIYKIP